MLLNAGAKTVIITSIEVEEGTLELLGGTQNGRWAGKWVGEGEERVY